MTEELKVKDKDIVVPGEVVASGMGYLPSRGSYREGDNIVASRLGMVNVDRKVIKIIPMSGRYQPKPGDVIIGQVIDVLFSGWKLGTNTAYPAMLSMKDATSEYIAKGADLTKYYDVGDYIVAKIVNVTSQNLIDLTMRGPGLKKLQGGRVIKASTHKVPRIIGKQGSMISMVKRATDCRIVVGQNGLVWLDGEPKNEMVAINTIRKIEEEAHISGLTDRIKSYLEKQTGKKVEVGAVEASPKGD
jgi:exosome complex component RRP4